MLGAEPPGSKGSGRRADRAEGERVSGVDLPGLKVFGSRRLEGKAGRTRSFGGRIREGDPSGEGLSYWERVEGARSQYFFVR